MEKIDKIRIIVVGLVVFLGGAIATNHALAHHSVAAYDLSKRVALKGTIREFDWENPHSWIWIDVPTATGAVDPWGIEMSSPGALRRAGLKWDSIQKGDKVTMSIFPLRDGRHGGGLAKITWQDGHSWQPTGQASPLPPGVAPTVQGEPSNRTFNGSTP